MCWSDAMQVPVWRCLIFVRHKYGTCLVAMLHGYGTDTSTKSDKSNDYIYI